MSRTTMRSAVLKGVIVFAAAAVVLSAARQEAPTARFVEPAAAASHLRLSDESFPLPVTTPSVHAVSLAPMTSGRLLAAWFGGTREGARDVSIYLSRFDGRQWSPAETIATPARMSAATGHYTRKLGNPVLHVDARGLLHLFVVSVAIGGWSTSYIEHAVSSDGGRSFSEAERLRLSPFLNLSHLVRTPALNLEDGGFLLPVYFELGRKYPVAVCFDAGGRVVSRQRLPGPAHLLQPAVSVHGTDRAEAFMRDARKRRVHACGYGGEPGGRPAGSWSPAVPIDVENPDSSVAVLPAADGGHWLACNPLLRSSRSELVLQKLDASLKKEETIVAVRAADGEFSYPALALTDDGRIHLVYTDRRKGLTHRIFEAAHE